MTRWLTDRTASADADRGASRRKLCTALYWLLVVVGTAYVAGSLLGITGIGGCDGPIVACDAAAYYFTDHGPYRWADAPPGVPPYRYAPIYLWAFAPFHLLPFDIFVWVWAALHIAALLWLRAGWMLAVPGMNEDVIRGNINVFIALALVLAVRHGGPWAFLLLTKVTPAIGMVWHVIRREWSALALAVAVTLAITAIGITFQPDLWRDWVESLAGAPANYRGVDLFLPLPLRLAVGVLVVTFAAMTSRAWLLPVGILAAWPGLLPPAFMVLASIPRLRTVAAIQRDTT